MAEGFLFPLISAGITLLLLILLLVQRRRYRRLKSQFEGLEQQLQVQLPAVDTFSQSLVTAERVQAAVKIPPPQSLPDRYRYIGKMAQQGMDAAQIATILQMGEAEVAQIVSLHRLKKGTQT